MSFHTTDNPKIKYDFQNEVLDEFFRARFAMLTSEQKERIPFELVRKIDKPHRLTFAQKAHIFNLCFKKPCFILFPADEGDNDFNVDEFFKLLQNPTIENTEKLIDNFGIVISNKELVDAITRANVMGLSSAAKYIFKIRNPKTRCKSQIEEYKSEIISLNDCYYNYECSKIKFLFEKNITLQEWYALMYLYDGKEKHMEPYYKRIKGAFGGSRSKIARAFPSLKQKGYVERIGEGYKRNIKYKITILGIDLVNEIYTKYTTNF